MSAIADRARHRPQADGVDGDLRLPRQLDDLLVRDQRRGVLAVREQHDRLPPQVAGFFLPDSSLSATYIALWSAVAPAASLRAIAVSSRPLSEVNSSSRRLRSLNCETCAWSPSRKVLTNWTAATWASGSSLCIEAEQSMSRDSEIGRRS